MARYFLFSILVSASIFLFSSSAMADEIGTGKPNSSVSSQSIESSTDDEIGTGKPWYEQLLQSFESDDSE